MERKSQSAEEALARSLTDTRDDPAVWDFQNPRPIDRGSDPVAELYLRVPLGRLQALTALAGERGLTVTQALEAALDAYLEAAPQRQKV